MELTHTKRTDCMGLRISAVEDGAEVGRATLYILYNDLHEEPFGLMEDVFVEKARRGGGIGTAIIKEIIRLAREHGCYKLVGASRYSREQVHEMYTRLGFRDHGKNFRMDLI